MLTVKDFRGLLVAAAVSAGVSGQTNAQPAVASMEDMTGTWNWLTNPKDKAHRWAGLLIIDEVAKNGSFEGRQTGDESRIKGQFTATSVSWSRSVPKDSDGSDSQSWRGTLSYGFDETKRPQVVITGTWSGAWVKDANAKGGDLEFRAVKHYVGTRP